MGTRTTPSRSFLTRDRHRHLLTAHFFLLVVGLGAALLINRRLTPETLWAPWLALVWGLTFVAHLLVFSRATLATMGTGREQRRARADEPKR